MPEYNRVAAAVILRALSDAQGIECNDRIEPLIWLASRAAEPYFDLLGLPQDKFLLRSGWMELADKIRENPDKASDAQLALLATTYDYLAELAG